MPERELLEKIGMIFTKEKMEEIKQDMFIMFRDGTSQEFENYAQHQLGNGFIQILTNDAAYIYPADRIQYIRIEQGE